MKETIKLIFLDIDGVLNSHFFQIKTKDWDTRDKSTQIDPVCVGFLNEIIAATSAKIVISSTWRILFYDEIPSILEKKGFLYSSNIIGKTPKTFFENKRYKHAQRGMQIQQWLDENQTWIIDRFIILDDSDDMGHLLPRWVRVPSLVGLDRPTTDKAIAKLTKD